jgi:hypothetical protein
VDVNLMALRSTPMPGVFTRMNGSIRRVAATIQAAAIIAMALIVGCGVPSVTNVTPERLATGDPEVANTRLLPFQFEMRDPLSEDKRRAGARCRIGDAGDICGRAESDLVLHDVLPSGGRSLHGIESLKKSESVFLVP